MIKHVMRTGLLGLLAASVFGCSATAPGQSSLPSATREANAPVVELPREASENELLAPHHLGGSFETQQFAFRRGHRFRFRRILVANVPYYVPYYYPTYYPTNYPYYVPYYNYYDPTYYYVPAYYAPRFGGRSIVVRMRRDGRDHRGGWMGGERGRGGGRGGGGY